MATTTEKLNMEDVEKLKEERDVILGLAFKLVEFLKDTATDPNLLDDEKAVIAAIEAFRPKLEPMECWAVSWKSGHRTFYPSEQEAKAIATSHDGITHLRAPVEWERWKSVNKKILASGVYQGSAVNSFDANDIAKAHNAEMERVTGTEGK